MNTHNYASVTGDPDDGDWRCMNCDERPFRSDECPAAPFITVKEAARILETTTQAVYQLAINGRLTTLDREDGSVGPIMVARNEVIERKKIPLKLNGRQASPNAEST